MDTSTTRVAPSSVRLLRTSRRWTQDELSQAAGVSLRTVQRAERDGQVSVSTLKSLAAAFDVDAGELEAPAEPAPRSIWWSRFGVTCGYAGALLGGAISIRGQIIAVRAGEMTAEDFGVAAGLTGAFVGLSCALIGLLYRRYQQRNGKAA